MRFGDLPLAEAEGAFLAHSLKAGAIAFKKGRRLSAEDIDALRAAGIGRVIAAVLGADDVHEDEAALRIAEAVAGEGVTVETKAMVREAAHRAGKSVHEWLDTVIKKGARKALEKDSG